MSVVQVWYAHSLAISPSVAITALPDKWLAVLWQRNLEHQSLLSQVISRAILIGDLAEVDEAYAKIIVSYAADPWIEKAYRSG
jgi:hypothetical protein